MSMSDVDQAESGLSSAADSAGQEAEQLGSAAMSDADAAASDVASFLGGGLQKAYILILPGSSPAGGIGSAALGLAGVGAEDLAGSMSQDSSLQAAESQFQGVLGNRLEFLFNPTTYTLDKSAIWTHMPDQGSYPTATPQYVGSGQRSLSMEILLDASYSPDGNIQGAVDLLMSTLTPTRLSILMSPPSPPFVLFGWGENLGFLAYMDSVRVEYKLFRQDGTPIRASAQISMREIPVGLASQNPTSGGDARRTRRTVSGDTLQSLAYRELGKPTMWRAIAETNGVEDPTRIPPGTTMLIPKKSDAAAMA